MSVYDQAENEAVEALEQGLDVNESPDTGEESGSQEEVEGEQSQGAASNEGAAAQQTQQADDFDSNKWTLKFRGRDVIPKDRQHLINLAQQGYLYSQRAQDLKTREEQLNQQASQYEQYKKLAEAFKANPKLQEKIMSLYHQEVNGQGQPQQQPGQPNSPQPDLSAIQPYLQKIETLEQRLSQFDNVQADKELRAEVDGLRQKYPDANWDQMNEEGRTFEWEVLNHAYKNGMKTLEQAYRDLMWDSMQTQTRANAIKSQAEQQQKLRKQGIVSGRTSQAAPTPPAQNIRELDYNQIAEKVISGDLK